MKSPCGSIKFILLVLVSMGGPPAPKAFGQAGTVLVAMCESAFVRGKKREVPPPPLRMHHRYLGEDRGQFRDPITNEPWNVKYFDRYEREGMRVIIKDGLFYDAKGEKLNSGFDAESLTFEEALIVVSKSYHIYIYPRDLRGEIHHSSILAGDDVMFAGMSAFSDGRIRVLTDRSGHYTPTPEHVKWFIRLLSRSGVDLSMMTLMGRSALHFSSSPAMRFREIQSSILDYSQYIP